VSYHTVPIERATHMKLADLLGDHPYRLLCGDLDVEVLAGVTTDSRRIQHGSLFVAVIGRRQNGHALLGEAFAKGAVAALVSDPDAVRPEGMTVALVSDTLAAASYAAARYQGEPGGRMKVISITGTNGKTSIAAMLASIIQSLSPTPVGVIGTGGPRIDGVPLPRFLDGWKPSVSLTEPSRSSTTPVPPTTG